MIGLDTSSFAILTPVPSDFLRCLQAGMANFWHGEVRCHRKSGESFPAWQSVSVVRSADGQLTHFVTAFSDVTAIYEAQQQLHHLAHHDPLTGLPNRLLFDDRLQERDRAGVTQ